MSEAPVEKQLLLLIDNGVYGQVFKMGSYTEPDDNEELDWYDDSYDDWAVGSPYKKVKPIAWFDPDTLKKNDGT